MQKHPTPQFLQMIRVPLIAIGLVLVIVALISLVQPAVAAPSSSDPAMSPQTSACLTCHSKVDFNRPLPSGEILSLTIDSGHFDASVHSTVDCTDCHTTISSFPHPKFSAQNLQDVSAQFTTSCQACHADQYDKTIDSVHQAAHDAGNPNTPLCTDCHNPHTQTQLTDENGAFLTSARTQVPQTCARCHSGIYDQYQTSIHGSALLGEGNADVPTCINCHGVHNIQDPTTNNFRLNSPELCSNCHTDPEIMDKYGISTNVLSSYVSDFHGTTIMFDQQTPDQAADKPVCYDCHGVHNIQSVDNPEYGLAMKQNLLTTCQKCHPSASANFPDAWMNHYIPSPEHNPIVYYVQLFYKFFIPGVLGPMVIYVLSDIVRRLIERRKGAKHA
jgi:hypothetical protein